MEEKHMAGVEAYNTLRDQLPSELTEAEVIDLCTLIIIGYSKDRIQAAGLSNGIALMIMRQLDAVFQQPTVN